MTSSCIELAARPESLWLLGQNIFLPVSLRELSDPITLGAARLRGLQSIVGAVEKGHIRPMAR